MILVQHAATASREIAALVLHLCATASFLKHLPDLLQDFFSLLLQFCRPTKCLVQIELNNGTLIRLRDVKLKSETYAEILVLAHTFHQLPGFESKLIGHSSVLRSFLRHQSH